MEKTNLKEKYVNYFLSNNHKFLTPASLVPDDNTTLFTSAGIQQLVPYMLNGRIHEDGGRLVNYQKCLRLTDIDNIGDSYHHTFFEMLGNWSLDAYFKKEVIEMSFDFLVNVLKLDINKLAISVFEGDDVLPRDEEAAKIWEELGIPRERIAFLGAEDNWWPSVNEKGPCGSDTEMFYWRSNDPVPTSFDPNDRRWVEIWNNVFIQYNRDDNMNLTKLEKKYIDTGMGVERVTSILNDLDDNYKTELFQPLIAIIEEQSNKNYDNELYQKHMRIIADHIRAVIMICSDGRTIYPSNKDRGYILRRLLRRLIISSYKLDISNIDVLARDLVNKYVEIMNDYYPYVSEQQDRIIRIISDESTRFVKVLKDGEKRISKAIEVIRNNGLLKMDSEIIFRLYETYGIPLDLTYSILDENDITYSKSEVDQLFEMHREKSKKSVEAKFGEGLASNDDVQRLIHKK